MPAALETKSPLRRLLLVPIVALGLAVQMVVSSRSVSGATPAAPVVPDAPTTLVVPATVYTSIASCDVAFSKSDLTDSDTFTVTSTFGGTGWLRIGADGLGPDGASVLVDSAFVSGLPTGSVADIRAALSMAPGTHTMDFYAVDASGAATGDPLCRVPYTLASATWHPEFVGSTELPRGTRGTLYSSNSGGRGGDGGNAFFGGGDVPGISQDGQFVFTPTVTDPYTVESCELVSASHDGGLGGSSGNGGNGGAGGLFAIELRPSTDGRLIELVDTGFHINLLDVAGQIGPTSCAELTGTPTKAGAYSFTMRLLYRLTSGLTGSSLPATVTEGVDEQTFATYQTFTLIVEETPSFTG